MSDQNLNDLAAFMVVAREQNFTRAAKRLGVSQSALSQTVRGWRRSWASGCSTEPPGVLCPQKLVSG